MWQGKHQRLSCWFNLHATGLRIIHVGERRCKAWQVRLSCVEFCPPGCQPAAGLWGVCNDTDQGSVQGGCSCHPSTRWLTDEDLLRPLITSILLDWFGPTFLSFLECLRSGKNFYQTYLHNQNILIVIRLLPPAWYKPNDSMLPPIPDLITHNLTTSDLFRCWWSCRSRSVDLRLSAYKAVEQAMVCPLLLRPICWHTSLETQDCLSSRLPPPFCHLEPVWQFSSDLCCAIAQLD